MRGLFLLTTILKVEVSMIRLLAGIVSKAVEC